MTNNCKLSDLKIVEFYTTRGQSKRMFGEMNDDFIRKKLPFSFL